VPTPYQRFLRSVAEVPDAVAIDLGDRCVGYGDLGRLVANVSGHLAALGLPPASGIGLVGTRALPTYVSYLAILRLGHVVVPLGPDNPIAFQRTVVRLASLRAVLVDAATHPDLAAVAVEAGAAVLDPGRCLRSEYPPTPTVDGSQPDQLAYILFTSGSTGSPKGVPITNANLSAYLDHVIPRYGIGPGARLSQTFALTFDPSVFDLLGSLTSGGTLVVPRNRELLAPAAYVNARRLTHWYSVPSLISHARRIGNLAPAGMPHLRWSGFIGEPLTLDQARAWRSAAPDSVIENVYGPTELTISCAEYRLARDPADWPETGNGTVPIGAVYPHLHSRVAGPDTDEGELWIRGPQRFAGYLDPDDNAGRFVAPDDEPATSTLPGRPASGAWYRTGDRVRHHDGCLVHLGRLDRQVKVNGYRIELGDVEAAIRRHPAVDDVAVLTVPDDRGASQLFAFLCGNPARADDLTAYLRATVPAYLVPSDHGWLESLPLNPSGKVDHAALRRIAGAGAL
jgi:amino acid adenylation domain-containing protein